MEYNDAYIKSALDAAATRTYRMAARFGLSPADREDLQQELILDLLEHQEKFDPTKGSAGTFTGMVSKHRSAELLDRLMKDRSRLSFIGHLGANADDDVDGNTISDQLDKDDHNVVLMWAPINPPVARSSNFMRCVPCAGDLQLSMQASDAALTSSLSILPLGPLR